MNRSSSVRLAITAAAIGLIASACGSSTSDPTLELPDTSAVGVVLDSGIADAAPTTPAEPSPAPASPAPASAAKALPTSEALCALVSAADLKAIFGRDFDAGTPSGVSPEFPGCTWKGTADESLQVSVCCPNMSAAQIETSLNMTGGDKLADNVIGGVRSDDFKHAQIHAYRNDVFFDVLLDGIGEKNALGSEHPTKAQLPMMVDFVEKLAAKL